jgi:hypothetical protein
MLYLLLLLFGIECGILSHSVIQYFPGGALCAVVASDSNYIHLFHRVHKMNTQCGNCIMICESTQQFSFKFAAVPALRHINSVPYHCCVYWFLDAPSFLSHRCWGIFL